MRSARTEVECKYKFAFSTSVKKKRPAQVALRDAYQCRERVSEWVQAQSRESGYARALDYRRGQREVGVYKHGKVRHESAFGCCDVAGEH
jgi:hypothetical protein